QRDHLAFAFADDLDAESRLPVGAARLRRRQPASAQFGEAFSQLAAVGLRVHTKRAGNEIQWIAELHEHAAEHQRGGDVGIVGTEGHEGFYAPAAGAVSCAFASTGAS